MFNVRSEVYYSLGFKVTFLLKPVSWKDFYIYVKHLRILIEDIHLQIFFEERKNFYV
jgi:hypothetical protein